MKISVCVPTYNRPDQVAQLLANLKNQQVMPEEILFVDASPDERTFEVVELFADRLAGLRHERAEKGLTRQRNRAIDLASGDILLFLDDDILLESEFIRNLKAVFLRDENRDVAGIAGVFTNQPIRNVGLGWRLKLKLGIIETAEPGRLLACGETTALPRPAPGDMFKVDFLPGGFTAWRKSVFDSYRYAHFFEGYGLGEDKYFSACVGRRHALYVSGDLRGQHLHVAGNRPNPFRWGFFNVYNHCFIMRQCSTGRWKWGRFVAFHFIDILNDLVSWPIRHTPKRTLLYGFGRAAGLVKSLFFPPSMSADDPAWKNRNAESLAVHYGSES